MTTTGALLLASSCLYGGFQWTVRVLVYPQLARVPAAEFVGYEAQHQRLVSIVVGPLFLFFGGAAVAAVVVAPGVASIGVAGCYGVILLATGLGAVPQHRRLTEGFDPTAYRRLLAVDSVRLASAVLACVASAVFALTHP